ncbi:MAG: hypothetical protein U5K43_08355 [Halofilum sp. (in: g-proteobacteria)]|nr:hypothetical protein [Halofilum sp. (in: g-proteobacteria)]
MATPDDVDALVELGKRMFERTRFGDLDFDHEKGRKVLLHAIDNPGYMLGVAVASDGPYAGLHLANMQQYFFCNDWMAQSVLYFVAPEYRGSSAAIRLLRLFWRWAEKRRACEITLGTGLAEGVSLARMDRFMRRAGLQQVGGLYARWLR